MPDIADVEALARGAGEILRSGFGGRYEIEYKSLIDPVTDVDRRSEAFIVAEIQRRFPKHTIVTEESGEIPGKPAQVWTIDPLDGTVNFSHGLPIFCVSIAYAENGQTRLGVVYDPMRDECFTAVQGQGAWLNQQPIQVSKRLELDHSLLATGFPYDIRTNPQTNLELFSLFMLRSQAVRRLGAAALDLCYVAAGRFDGYWESDLYPWDVAAAVLVAQEAGAQVTSMEGNADYFQPPISILAANPELHAQILAHLQGHQEK